MRFVAISVNLVCHTCSLLIPSATHSPIFQVMVGDSAVDLTSQFPFVVPSKDRALRLTQDPVAAADFFQFASHVLSSICLGGTTCHGHLPKMAES